MSSHVPTLNEVRSPPTAVDPCTHLADLEYGIPQKKEDMKAEPEIILPTANDFAHCSSLCDCDVETTNAKGEARGSFSYNQESNAEDGQSKQREDNLHIGANDGMHTKSKKCGRGNEKNAHRPSTSNEDSIDSPGAFAYRASSQSHGSVITSSDGLQGSNEANRAMLLDCQEVPPIYEAVTPATVDYVAPIATLVLNENPTPFVILTYCNGSCGIIASRKCKLFTFLLALGSIVIVVVLAVTLPREKDTSTSGTGQYPSLAPTVQPSAVDSLSLVCGTDWADAVFKNCANEGVKCPDGIDQNCPSEEKCFANVPRCSSAPSTASKKWYNICGSTYIDAKANCAERNLCPNGKDSECTEGQTCYAQVPCSL